jgi:hypothetical protein
MREPTLSRRSVVVLAAIVLALLGSGVAAAYLRQETRQVSVDDAVAAFRSTSSTPQTEKGLAPGAAPAPTSEAAVTTSVDAPPAPPGTALAGSVPPPTPTQPAKVAPSPAAQTSSSATPTPAATAAAPPSTEEGVYTFNTEGYESTNALGGARHDYPAETAVTLRRTDCGWTQRWQPLQERWDETALCHTDQGMDVRRFTTHHEFFQRSQEQAFDCPEGSNVHRWNAPPGATWTWRCTAGSSAIDTVVTVEGTEPLDLGGETVDVVRIRYESKMTGANRGTQVQERWLRPGDGLNVRIHTDIDTETDSPFGAVHYEEHYTITMASLHPRR